MNYLQPITIKMSLKQLIAFNVVWNYSDLYIYEIEECARAMPSILRQVVQKFKNKELKLSIEPTKSGSFTIKLQCYEALFLEMYVRGITPHMQIGLEKTTASSIADEINQKLA